MAQGLQAPLALWEALFQTHPALCQNPLTTEKFTLMYITMQGHPTLGSTPLMVTVVCTTVSGV